MKPGDADLTEPRRGFGPSSTGKNLDSTQEGGLKSQNRLKRHVFMCVNINFSWLKPAHARTHPSHGFCPSHVFARAQERPEVKDSYLTLRFQPMLELISKNQSFNFIVFFLMLQHVRLCGT